MADPTDDPLWTMLRRRLGEPVPDDVRAAARGALSWRDPDAALAALVLDSDDPETVMAGQIRGGGEPRLLSFAAAELAIDIEVTYGPETVSLIGQLAPAGPTEVAIDHRFGVLTAAADRLGRFQAAGIECGPVRLRATPGSDGPPVHTAWIVL